MDEAALIHLAIRYEDWMHHPATQDFLGRCYIVQRNLGEAILRGDLDQHGNDRVEWLRGGYALANDIIAIPAKVQAQREFVEREILGVVRNLSAPAEPGA